MRIHTCTDKAAYKDDAVASEEIVEEGPFDEHLSHLEARRSQRSYSGSYSDCAMGYVNGYEQSRRVSESNN